MSTKLVWIIAIGIAVMGVSCKPKQSAYKAAYEKAQEKQLVTPEETAAPATVPITEVKTPAKYYGGATTERVTGVDPSDIAGLKEYNVVVGSFGSRTNATALKESLIKDGYKVVLATNEKGMYRVIIASFDNRADAETQREAVKERYPNQYKDAWLLINH